MSSRAMFRAVPLVVTLVTSAGAVAALVAADYSRAHFPGTTAEDQALLVYGIRHFSLGLAMGWILLVHQGWRISASRGGLGQVSIRQLSWPRFWKHVEGTVWCALGIGLALGVTVFAPTSWEWHQPEEEVWISLVFLSSPTLCLTTVVLGLSLRYLGGMRGATGWVASCMGLVALGPCMAHALVSGLGGWRDGETRFVMVFLVGESVPLGLVILLCLALWWQATTRELRTAG